MKSREKIIVLIIIGYLLVNLSILAINYSITFENNKDQSLQMVEVYGNGTTRSYEIESPEPNIFMIIIYGILAGAMRLIFVISMGLAGFGLIIIPMGFLEFHVWESPEGFRVVVFWIIAMITIPINYMFTKDIPIWRRIPYIYVLAAIISITPMIFTENFGQ